MKRDEIKAKIKLLAFQFGYREQNFGSCFGPYTEKYDELYKWLKQAENIPGDILEFGVATGGTTCLIAYYIKAHASPKTIDSFDSFAGFAPKEFDDNVSLGYVTNPSVKYSWQTYEFSFAYVQRKLKAHKFFPFTSLHKGFFQDTLLEFLNQNDRLYSFALIDCDLASSIDFCAKSIFPYMSTGGIILFDDYASIEPNKPDTAYSFGVKKVVDQFVSEHSPSDHGYNNGLYHFVKS